MSSNTSVTELAKIYRDEKLQASHKEMSMVCNKEISMVYTIRMQIKVINISARCFCRKKLYKYRDENLRMNF